MPVPRVWSVWEVNSAVRSLLEQTLPEVWISGEVGGWTRARSGHAYFTLKDQQAQLRCVMWRSHAVRLPIEPEVGMRVRALGSLTLYEARGEYQLAAREVVGEGEEGLWRLAFEKLRVQLEGEGLLAAERKRPLPRFPASVGVVTSSTGAALHDILTVLRRRAPWTRVVVRFTRVQGEGAAPEIADAVRVLGGSGEVELLIVGRGGGSVEDLWAFNEEPVARAIAATPVPVVSAVGHEMDVTIADLVADLRAPTPSAAAEAAVQDGRVLREVLQGVRPRLARALRHRTERSRSRMEDRRARLTRGMSALLAPQRQGVGRWGERLERGMRTLLDARSEGLAAAAGKIEALSPLATLRRGYSVALDEDGRALRRADDFHPGPFDLRIVDGRVKCEAVEVLKEGA